MKNKNQNLDKNNNNYHENYHDTSTIHQNTNTNNNTTNNNNNQTNFNQPNTQPNTQRNLNNHPKPKTSFVKSILLKFTNWINNFYRTFLCTYLLTIELIAVLSQILILILISPVYLVSKPWFYHIELIGYDWLATLVASFTYLNGFKLESAGDIELLKEIIKNQADKAIVISNHQSLSDVPVIMNFWLGLNEKGKDGKNKDGKWSGKNGYRGVTWVMDYVISYTHWGWVCSAHSDFFLLQGGDMNCCMKACKGIKTKEQLRDMERRRLAQHIPIAFERHRFLTLFPEGGLFCNRKASSDRFAEKAGIAKLDYVTIPRMGALEIIVKAVRDDQMGKLKRESDNKNGHKIGVLPAKCNDTVERQNISDGLDNTKLNLLKSSWSDKVKYVVDLTIVYPDHGKPTPVAELQFGPNLKTHLDRRALRKEEASLRLKNTVFVYATVYNLDECPTPFDKSHPDSSDNLPPSESINKSPSEKWWLDVFRNKDDQLRKLYENNPTRDAGKIKQGEEWKSMHISGWKLLWVHLFYLSFCTAVVTLVMYLCAVGIWAAVPDDIADDIEDVLNTTADLAVGLSPSN